MVAFVDEHLAQWPVVAMCAAIELSERTYYAARARQASARSLRDVAHRVEIKRVWENNHRCYGARRIYKQLRRESYVVARCTVARLMADMGLRGVQRGKKRFTTTPDTTAGRPPDLVDRRFVAGRPNQLWLADITYASTWEGWLYVAFVSDVYSRAIVGWQIAGHLRTDLVLDALEMAIWRRDLTGGELIHHSDAGCPVHLDPLQRPPGRDRHRRVHRLGRGFLRQRDGGGAERILQGRAGQPARPVADPPPARGRHHRMDRLVQRQPTALRNR